mgnify:CR=1 FL=1
MHLPYLRYMTQAGGRLKECEWEYIEKYSKTHSVLFYSMYGQTEATARISYLPWQKMNKRGSVGIAVPETIVTIDEYGEIIVKGNHVCLGYAENYKDLCMGDEWHGVLHTGDIGKYDKEGNARAIPGHNLSIAALGVFILWFCWFGFNCGSTTAASTNLGDIAMTTNLAAAAATLATLVVTWIRYGKPDVSMTFNGSLAGLVAITAGCDTVSNYSTIIIGLIAGILVVFSVEFFDKVAKIDDPVGAISVHGVCGFTGSILVGVFSPECPSPHAGPHIFF